MFNTDRVKRGEKPLDWDTRLNLAIGAARGLSYLHHDCIPHIIHRDIKTSNILLDENMEARVADFGLAKLMNPQQTHVTTVVAGTLGYLPPGGFCYGSLFTKLRIFLLSIILSVLVALSWFSKFEFRASWSRIHGDWKNHRERRRL